MTLNGTLIVQLFNFLLAYVLIDRLLLRKSVALIRNQEQEQADLMAAIELESTKVMQQDEHKLKQWQEYREEFVAHMPQLKSLDPLEVPQVITEPIAEHAITEAKDELADLIIRKVDDVNS